MVCQAFEELRRFESGRRDIKAVREGGPNVGRGEGFR